MRNAEAQNRNWKAVQKTDHDGCFPNFDFVNQFPKLAFTSREFGREGLVDGLTGDQRSHPREFKSPRIPQETRLPHSPKTPEQCLFK